VEGLKALLFEGGELVLATLLQAGNRLIPPGLDGNKHVGPLFFASGRLLLHLLAQMFEGPLFGRLVDVRDQVLGEVEDALQAARRNVEQEPDGAGRALDEPDMSDGRGKLDVAHALPPDLASRHFDAAFVADNALIADALVFPAVALEVLGRAENLLA